jgi:hypothetical protein
MLQYRNMFPVQLSYYPPPPGTIVGGSNIRHCIRPHITLLKARNIAFTAFQLKHTFKSGNYKAKILVYILNTLLDYPLH